MKRRFYGIIIAICVVLLGLLACYAGEIGIAASFADTVQSSANEQ